ncbi:hypothetical protein PSTG_05592 [Puccinia striiformis f. sp. tritici PST-78]|uniref:Uncharacterized protein n=1 Tax=Puccinia striiformis f. sp. tritici PST-78 TaxID=1165861 RepID=A0A0L0VQD6_9BASI|nr:hypothetical protein PSTG_05592 [Puccinia striiformis f. sp. tritici PST-78]
MLEDTFEGLDPLHHTTNAQESMHQLYYMIRLTHQQKVKEATKNKGFSNVDHNPFTTYAGYLGSKDPQGRNQCCMATAMEALYVIYNPLWLRDTNSTGKDMFSALCHHFNSCVKYKLTELGQIRSVLSKGQSQLFNLGKIDTKALKGLLTAEEYWTYSCLKHPKYCHGTSSKPRTVFAITIKKDYFEDNHTAPSNVTELLNHSTLTGLKVWPGIHCRTCITFNSNSNTSMHQPVEPLSITSIFDTGVELTTGNTCVINTNPATIGGTSPDSSLLMYSRDWAADEDQFIQLQMKKISTDNPAARQPAPFVHFCDLLKISEEHSKHNTKSKTAMDILAQQESSSHPENHS